MEEPRNRPSAEHCIGHFGTPSGGISQKVLTMPERQVVYEESTEVISDDHTAIAFIAGSIERIFDDRPQRTQGSPVELITVLRRVGNTVRPRVTTSHSKTGAHIFIER
jgi:hypothetical protein